MINLESPFVGDIETKGFLENLHGESDFHVLGIAYKSGDSWEVKTTNKKEDVKKVFENPDNTIVGHNFFLYDVPALEKMFKDIEIKATIVDSLLLAWYIDPNRIKKGKKYGLEYYGEDFGVPKPVVTEDEWSGIGMEKEAHAELMKHRVSQDVRINTNLWVQQLRMLRELYDNDDERIKSLLNFLMTKGKQYKMHQDFPLLLDIPKALENVEKLESLIENKVSVLAVSMPETPVKVKRKRPKAIYKKDGNPTAAGERWLKITKHYGVDQDYEGELEEITGYKEPNPQSVSQVKDWLFSLGWVPRIFVESVLKSGEVNRVPQIKDKKKNLCPSVLELAEKEPAIKELDDLGVIQHRLGIVKGFLKNSDEEGNIVGGIAGLTNTLRIRHKYLVNMPKPSAPYGEYVRSLIKPQEGRIMIGADLSGLENTTRNNFIMDFDPDYVSRMKTDFYDSHLEIGVTAGLISEAESHFYKWWKEVKKNPETTPTDIGELPEDYNFIEDAYKTKEDRQKFFDDIDLKRSQAKTVGFSALYGVGATKLSKELKVSKKEAKGLLDAYWKINWSVRAFAETCETKEALGGKWVKNPMNNYWYSLRSDKDIFSVVNQGGGDYVFTLWVHFVMKLGLTVQFGAHDELIVTCLPNEEEKVIKILYEAIDNVNKVLKLRIPIGIDYNVGKNYAEVH